VEIYDLTESLDEVVSILALFWKYTQLESQVNIDNSVRFSCLSFFSPENKATVIEHTLECTRQEDIISK